MNKQEAKEYHIIYYRENQEMILNKLHLKKIKKYIHQNYTRLKYISENQFFNERDIKYIESVSV